MRHRPQKGKVCSTQNPCSAHPSSGRGSQGVAGPLASRRTWGVRNEGLRGAAPHPWSGQPREATLGHLRETVLGDSGLPPAGTEGVQALRAAGRRAGRQERGQAGQLEESRGPFGVVGVRTLEHPLCSPGNPRSRSLDDSSSRSLRG